MELSFSEDVKEWTKAHYKCKNGTKIPDDFDVADLVDGNFTVPCGSGGKYPVCINTSDEFELKFLELSRA